ncbi:MAG TPA: outer membrane lipoprotein-sorting protein [Acidobacteriota bacterium]
MEANSRLRERSLAGYTGMRTYRAANGDDDDRKAEMQVRVVYASPSTKDFMILSEEGSGFIRDRVFKKAMETEKEAQHPESKRRSALTTDNYDFTLVGTEKVRGRHCYMVEIRPKRKDKFLVRGYAWIDSLDFAVVRIEGELVKPPSFMTRKVQIVRDYAKVGDFWLPQKDVSTSQLLLFGKSTMTVHYYDYIIKGREPVTASAGSVSASLK